jgi:predicted RNA-binding protein YlxR (DUF448 family)/ribosomal protein L7Ae-like RNA K-turn-binding protein
MIETTMHVNAATTGGPEAHRGRTRTCVGCCERVDVLSPEGADLIRLILGPDGVILVDARGSGFGRGAHVHARRTCLERAARAGLLRVTKGQARRVLSFDSAGEAGEGEALSTDALARAIQSSMDHRIEGLLRAAVRSGYLAHGAAAVTSACGKGDGAVVLVACDAGPTANLAEVQRAVAEGRAVAWGTKERLGAIIAPAPVRGRLGSDPSTPSSGVGVVSIASRSIAEALRQAVRAADTVTSSAGAAVTSPEGAAASDGDRRRRGARRLRGSSH